MAEKTENLKLNINYHSPDTLYDQRLGLDENFQIIDQIYPLIFEGLDKVNEKFSEVIDLDNN